MSKKERSSYLIIITLIIILSILWILIINTTKGTQNKTSNTTSSDISYSAVTEINEDKQITEGTYSSANKDENAIAVSGSVNATLSKITVKKTGSSAGGDNTSFYGTNSAILAKNGANITIKNVNISTDATGANGVFSYGGSATTNNSSSDNTTINISDSTIQTHQDNSGGIMTTGGGIMNASNLNITTEGISSAAIRSDRGGGSVNVNKGTYKTTGKGSPTIYSTADITVKNATLIATASEGAIIEGKNSITLENVKLDDTNNELNGQSTTYKNIFIYQSMSGDAEDGEAIFNAKNSTITTNKGDSIYVTNTKATINLENNTFINNDEDSNFLRIQKDSWGNTGNNGGNVTLNLTNQNITGNIIVDAISTLSMNLTNNSSFIGAINNSNEGEVALVIDKSSSLTLTGDTYIKSLQNKDSSNSNINLNGYKLYVDGTEFTK